MNRHLIGYGCVALSLAAHASALFGTQQLATPHSVPALPALELMLPDPPVPITPPRAPTMESTQPTKPPPIRASLPAAHRVAAPEPATPPSPTEPPPAAEPLASTDDSSWAIQTGDGKATSGVVHAVIPSPSPSPSPAPPATPKPAEPSPVPFAQLSRRPVPPSLAAALERNYPAVPRAQGRSGEAKVRALIDQQGRVRSATITSESAAGFGAACQTTLLQSRWTPPIGQHGQPSSTFVSYRCKFQVHD